MHCEEVPRSGNPEYRWLGPYKSPAIDVILIFSNDFKNISIHNIIECYNEKM